MALEIPSDIDLSAIPAALTKMAEYINANSGSVTLAALTAVVAALPTTLPADPGQLWLNGGVLALS